jgi:hypothetical protein
MKTVFRILFSFLIVVSACKQKTTAEKALDGIEETVDDTGKEIKENSKDADEEANKKAKKKKKSLKDIKIKF